MEAVLYTNETVLQLQKGSTKQQWTEKAKYLSLTQLELSYSKANNASITALLE